MSFNKSYFIVILILPFSFECFSNCVPSRHTSMLDYPVSLQAIQEGCELSLESSDNSPASELYNHLAIELSINLAGHNVEIIMQLINQTLFYQFSFPPNENGNAQLTISNSPSIDGGCDMELEVDEQIITYFQFFNISIKEILKHSFQEACRKLWGL